MSRFPKSSFNRLHISVSIGNSLLILVGIDLNKHFELPVTRTRYHLPATSYQLPATSYQLQVPSSQFPVTGLPVTSYQLPVTSQQLPVPGYQHFSPAVSRQLYHTSSPLSKHFDVLCSTVATLKHVHNTRHVHSPHLITRSAQSDQIRQDKNNQKRMKMKRKKVEDSRSGRDYKSYSRYFSTFSCFLIDIVVFKK